MKRNEPTTTVTFSSGVVMLNLSESPLNGWKQNSIRTTRQHMHCTFLHATMQSYAAYSQQKEQHYTIDKIINEHEHSHSADLSRREQLRVRSPDPDSGPEWFPKCNVDFLVLRFIADEIFMKIRSVFPEIWAKWWKMPPLAMFKNPSEKFPHPDL